MIDDKSWKERLASIQSKNPSEIWDGLVALANSELELTKTIRLDRVLLKHFGTHPPGNYTHLPVRLAVLGSSTFDHLLSGLRVGALRRGLWLSTYTADYGQYLQEILDPQSGLHAFKPNCVLLAFDIFHLFGTNASTTDRNAAEGILDAAAIKIRDVWRLAREHFKCAIIQQTVIPLSPLLIGSNEHLLPGSLRRMTPLLNERLRILAVAEGIDILGLDDRIIDDGISAWHDPVHWYRGKQEITPAAAHIYGDLVARIIAAQQGRSFKCLVLDLDNTLWGGVIGDDGLEGIKLGQGSAMGEAFLAMQRYARDLSRRGIILAVCSKNDEANALSPFEHHPDMILKRSDIACFIANWQDKPANIRVIAERLNIGLDSLVFIDDSPFERNIVRRELPMVAVPELPEDPALYPYAIAKAGYFETQHITVDDLERSQQYHANEERELLKSSSTNIEDYLQSLKMELQWGPFDKVSLQRIHQLINKTNQFNLMTRRYTEAEVLEFLDKPGVITLQLRLIDRFGDNGIIGIVIGKKSEVGDVTIDTWLMSCRILGRGVEETTLNLLVAETIRTGGTRLIGEYCPTTKNGMVRDHYAKLGFTPLPTTKTSDTKNTYWEYSLEQFSPRTSFISTRRI